MYKKLKEDDNIPRFPFDEDLYYEELMKRIATSLKTVTDAVVADVGNTFSGTE